MTRIHDALAGGNVDLARDSFSNATDADPHWSTTAGRREADTMALTYDRDHPSGGD